MKTLTVVSCLEKVEAGVGGPRVYLAQEGSIERRPWAAPRLLSETPESVAPPRGSENKAQNLWLLVTLLGGLIQQYNSTSWKPGHKGHWTQSPKWGRHGAEN